MAGAAKIITIATDPMGTNTYGATAGYATIINKYNTLGLNVKVKPTTGAMDIAGILATGEAQLGVHNNFDAQLSWLTNIAVYLIGVSFEGYAVNNKLSIIERILFPIIALVLIIPNPEMRNQLLMIIKIVVTAIVFYFIFSLGIKNKRLLKSETV